MKKSASILTLVVLVVIIGLFLFLQKPKFNVDVTTTTTTTTTTTPDETQLDITPPVTTPPTVTPPETTPPDVTTTVTTLPSTDGGNVVTLDDNNKTFSMKADETFLLKLGEFYDWQPIIDNQDVLSREMDIAVISGAQGVYKAHKEGTAKLTATGDPLCRQSVPPCGAPSILFEVILNVTSK